MCRACNSAQSQQSREREWMRRSADIISLYRALRFVVYIKTVTMEILETIPPSLTRLHVSFNVSIAFNHVPRFNLSNTSNLERMLFLCNNWAYTGRKHVISNCFKNFFEQFQQRAPFWKIGFVIVPYYIPLKDMYTAYRDWWKSIPYNKIISSEMTMPYVPIAYGKKWWEWKVGQRIIIYSVWCRRQKPHQQQHSRGFIRNIHLCVSANNHRHGI